MGEIHATMNVSLDGRCDHTAAVVDDEYHERISDLFESYDALLFGRNTYDLLRGYWPGVAASGDGSPGVVGLAHILNAGPKFVVTSRDLTPGWNARRVAPSADAIGAMTDGVAGNTLLVASPTLASALLAWGLIDEYHVALSPITAGRGPRFLDGSDKDARPELRDVLRLRSGVLFVWYRFTPQADATRRHGAPGSASGVA